MKSLGASEFIEVPICNRMYSTEVLLLLARTISICQVTDIQWSMIKDLMMLVLHTLWSTLYTLPLQEIIKLLYSVVSHYTFSNEETK